ncbi:biliverdin-producing heme oxygenase, partial [Georgenia sp. 10Sc9-8]|nr:biliverdin-producing heme oxygenase [Georgenia halotolerans]
VDARALNFYHFPEVPRLKPVKDRYRAGLDLLHLTGAEQTEVVTEARRAFDLNRALLHQLGERHPSPVGGPARGLDDGPR